MDNTSIEQLKKDDAKILEIAKSAFAAVDKDGSG